MLVFAALSMGAWKFSSPKSVALYSRVLLSLGGMAVIALSTVACLGFISAIGIKLTPLSVSDKVQKGFDLFLPHSLPLSLPPTLYPLCHFLPPSRKIRHKTEIRVHFLWRDTTPPQRHAAAAVRCLYSAVHVQCGAFTVWCIYSAVPLQCGAYTVRCIYSAVYVQCDPSVVRCLYSAVPLQRGRGGIFEPIVKVVLSDGAPEVRNNLFYVP